MLFCCGGTETPPEESQEQGTTIIPYRQQPLAADIQRIFEPRFGSKSSCNQPTPGGSDRWIIGRALHAAHERHGSITSGCFTAQDRKATKPAATTWRRCKHRGCTELRIACSCEGRPVFLSALLARFLKMRASSGDRVLSDMGSSGLDAMIRAKAEMDQAESSGSGSHDSLCAGGGSAVKRSASLASFRS